MRTTNASPRLNPKIEDIFFDQLRWGFYNVVLITGFSLLIASLAFLSSNDDFYKYLGRITNSLAFQIVGLVMVYGYIRWFSRLKDLNQKRRYSVYLFVLALLVGLAASFQRDSESSFLSMSFENLAFEITGFVLVYLFVDKFMDQLQSYQQTLRSISDKEKESRLADLEDDLEKNRIEIANLISAYKIKDLELKNIKSIKNRIIGILSDRQTYSFTSIKYALNQGKFSADSDKEEDIQAALGMLNEEKRLVGDYRGYALKDSGE